MKLVICALLLHGALHKVQGRLIEQRGDKWLVAFKIHTIELNGNQCLYVTGGLYGRQDSVTGTK